MVWGVYKHTAGEQSDLGDSEQEGVVSRRERLLCFLSVSFGASNNVAIRLHLEGVLRWAVQAWLSKDILHRSKISVCVARP